MFQIPTAILIKLLGYLVVITSICGAIYIGYNHIKQIGYDEATIKCEANFKDYETKRDAKIAEIEKLANVLVSEGRTSNALLVSDISTILKNSKAKPLVAIKDGKCTPSVDLSDNIVAINKRINKTIRESQK